MSDGSYIHGTEAEERTRLAALNRLTNDVFVSFLRPRSDDEVLELGSGLGLLAHDVARLVPAGRVVGLECSTEQLANAPIRAPNVQFVEGDAHALPFADGRFQVVYCRYVLEHVRDPVRVASEARRVLERGGSFFVQENDVSVSRVDPPSLAFAEVWAGFMELQRRLGGDPCVGTSLYRILRHAGFRDVELSLAPEVHWHGSAGFNVWIENLAGNLRGAAEQLVRERLVPRSSIEAALRDLSALRNDPEASAIFHWNRAVARK
jgi:SAM-dependent methyltransferase